ncbi:MAG: hypothetical protein LAP21_11525 [Acidobacteriia bacterium]|nr:hypothetical protein [Terriglobia bacterium]
MPQSNAPSRERPGARKDSSATGSIKSRAELKAFFRNGRLPDEISFAHLIDSFVHQNDLWEKQEGDGGNANGGTVHRITSLNRSWYVYVDSKNNLVVSESDAVRLRMNANDRVDIGGPDAPFALQVNGWAGIGMRLGGYNPADDTRKEFPSSALTRLQAPADGRWHPIITGLNSYQAFEVVASATGTNASSDHAITHAIAVGGVSGGHKSIRQTFSYDGWYWRRKISFKWQAGGGLFGKSSDYSLCVRTGRNFGKGDDGKPVMIRYHITRLW